MTKGPVHNSIELKLAEGFQPLHLQVENESHNHSVPLNAETHFKIVMVTEQFSDQRLVARHQAVYRLLDKELKGGVHALALHLYTEQEWRDKNGDLPLSPPCLGGSKVDPNVA